MKLRNVLADTPPNAGVTQAFGFTPAASSQGAAIETIHLMNMLGSVAFQPAGTKYWLVVAPPDLLNTAFDWLISPINPLPTPFASRLIVTGLAALCFFRKSAWRGLQPAESRPSRNLGPSRWKQRNGRTEVSAASDVPARDRPLLVLTLVQHGQGASA